MPLIDLVLNICLAVFAPAFVLHLALVEREASPLPVQLHWIDRRFGSAVFLYAYSAQGLLQWVFKFGRTLLQVVLGHSIYVMQIARLDS